METPEREEQRKLNCDTSDDQQELGLAMYMNSLALGLRDHYHDTGEEETLREAADIAERAMIVTSNQDSNLPRYYNSLGLILWDQYYHTGCPGTLEDAIYEARQATELAPKGCANRLRFLDDLSYMLHDRYEHFNDLSSLRESLKAVQETVQDCPDSHRDKPEYVDHFGRVLIDISVYTDSIHDLEQGLDQVRRSVESIPDGHSCRAQYLSTLASMLQEQYSLRLGKVDPTEAVQIARDAVAAVPEDSLERATYLHGLGTMLSDRFYYTRDRSDIDEGIQLLKQATAKFYDDDMGWVSRSIDLGRSLAARSAATGSLEDLNEAIAIAQEVLDASPDDHERRLKRSLYLASRLKERYIWTGSLSDCNEAIQVLKSNLALAPEDDPARGHAFHILGNAMGDRFSMSGSMADLDDAIKLAQKAVEVTPATDSEWPNFLGSLASSFASRYTRTGRLADLDEAIRIMERALDQTPEAYLSWIAFVSNLGGFFKNRYQRLRKASDLAKSIEMAQTAVDKCQRGHANRHIYLGSLARVLILRFDRDHSMADLDTAINLQYEAMEVSTTDQVDYSTLLLELGASWERKYAETNALADLEEAIRFGKKAVDAMGERHRYRTEALNNVGLYLGKRAAAIGSKDNEQEATHFYQRALMQTQSSVKSRIEVALRVITIYVSQSAWQLAYEAAVVAIDLMPQLILRSLGNADKQELLMGVGGLSSEAAGLALQLGKGPMVALNMLERGRGMLASSLDDLHADIDTLKEDYPDLATRFVSLRNKLGRDDMPREDSSLAWNPDTNERHEAGEEFDRLIAEIRHQPGFEDFLLPPTESQIKLAAKCGPIIVVNTCLLRCDAIIIEPHQIRAVPLPEFDRRTMVKFVKEGTLRSSLALEWLWACIASPVMDALGLTETSRGDWPHVWWVTTGLLTKFPIHAAGDHAKGHSNTVLDRVVSSYQTSVQSLIRSRKRPVATRSSQQALLVSMEKTPGSSDLPNATREIAAVRKVCESMSIKTVELEPHKEDIISQLLQSQIFHYAGHAYTDGHDPAESYLCLEANKVGCLTVSNLLDVNLQRQSPFLAYLSACGTGEMQNNSLTDEGVHLITGFQLLGFRHVIGTLWAVMDALCVHIAKLVYEELRDNGTTDRAVAKGLHNATRKLRDNWLDTLESNQRNVSVRVKSGRVCEDVGNKGGQENTRSVSTRDVVSCDEEVTWPDWIPYVHYGV